MEIWLWGNRPVTRPLNRDRSLAELERAFWPAPAADDTPLVATAHALRHRPIGRLTVEDLRLLIGQDIGLPHLLQLALDVLRENSMAEGGMYEGDLLSAVLTRSPSVPRATCRGWAAARRARRRGRQRRRHRVRGNPDHQRRYRTIMFRPRPGGGLTWAKAEHETPYGRAAIAWSLDGGELRTTVTVPTGAEGIVELPGAGRVNVESGTHIFTRDVETANPWTKCTRCARPMCCGVRYAVPALG
ncbi:contact-dependent growth inhibition system immunity protein [Streptomyces anulatus]|uniref:contact-dependent growth inhibition system immunity protein n=1 Tax=Streptomyces anulatus TaxID=1892 RepID=UPI0036DC0334